MNSQTKTCQNCKKEFTIEPEDFAFYQKIKVPAPTFCPDCRLIRRMIWRNERALYKRKCDATGENIISVYSSDKPFKVYDQKYWWSDEWDPLDYGRDYDFSQTFFKQFYELFKKIPHIALFNTNSINTTYANFVEANKNCYLISGSYKNEDISYADRSIETKDSLDLFIAVKSELCYENIYCENCFKLFFSDHCQNCQNSSFLYDCRNCSDCFSCAGLRNKQYYIFNKPHTKEEYLAKIKKMEIGSYENLSNIKKHFYRFVLKYPHKYAFLSKTRDTFGDNMRDSKNCHDCFDILVGPTEDCKFLEWGGFGLKDCYDCLGSGTMAEMHYEMIDNNSGLKDFFGVTSRSNNNLSYFINCHSSSNLFGCIGLRHKQYCILNKQYTKEEYDKLVPKIIEHMNSLPYIDEKGRVYRYGEFFPPELSPFCYNETIAQEYFPLTKEEAIAKGYSWKEPEERQLTITMTNDQIPDHIKDVRDDIIGKVIQCSHAKIDRDRVSVSCNEQCTTAFKIIEPELQFYRRMNIPLPRLCPNCRHYQRLKQRNPLKLWHRKCQCAGEKSSNGVYKNTIEHFHGNQPCPNEFETTYAPDRKEIVYCEECYLREVV